MSAKRFRIAFSLAGETHRVYVEAVAKILARRFGEEAILYDKFHEAEFSRSDLAFYLPDLYKNQADLIVVVFCREYKNKKWCCLEWNAIFGVLNTLHVKQVMLTRFDQVEAEGLRGLAGYVDLENHVPENTAELILERLALNEGKPKNFYTPRENARNSATRSARLNARILPSPEHPIYRCLHPRLQYFFGREDELDKIAEELAPEARGWGVLIDGPGGMGKTSLAIRAAELTPIGSFSRIIFVSAQTRQFVGGGIQPITGFVPQNYLAMLDEIAAQLSQPGLAQAPEEARGKFLQLALQNENALLILDNLETLPDSDRDKIYEFLRCLPLGCKAIVTSRRRSDIPARSLRLDRLTAEAALDLIAELAINHRHFESTTVNERNRFYEATGGNPLLIRWVVGQLGRGQCTSISAALQFLLEATRNDDPLEFVFGDLLDEFSDLQNKVLAALTHFTQPMEVKFISQLADTAELATKTALEDLAWRSLVVPDEYEEKFALAAMAADFLKRAKPEAVNTAGAFLVKHAYALIVQNGGENHDRFEQLEAAWPEVEPALDLFNQWPSNRFQQICVGLIHFLNYSGRWDERIAICMEAERKAVVAGDFETAGQRAYDGGLVYYRREQPVELLAYAGRVASHWEVHLDRIPDVESDKCKRAYAIRLRGLGRRLNRDYPAAISDFSEALAIFRSLPKEIKLVAMSLNDIGTAQRYAGNLDAAEMNVTEALKIAKEIDFKEGVASYTSGLARIAIERESWKQAETLARDALCLAKGLPRKELLAHASRRLAMALARQGQESEAVSHARNAVEIYSKLGSPNLESAKAVLEECLR